MGKVALAVDIGATKVALALVDRDFALHQKQELIIGSSTSESLWASIAETVKQVTAGLNGNLLGVGIGSAGPLHLDTGAISPVNIPIWRKYPIVNKFQDLLGIENVVLHGDAMALAHAEHVLGAGRGSENMLGMVVSLSLIHI